MKAISASIVAASGVLFMSVAGFISHSDTRGFTQAFSCAVGLAGLGAWLYCLRQNSSDT
jgi:uncharacterized membrane protein YphA (DoxX/SURF4 family)